MINEKLKELIVKSLLKQYPDLVAIYLFGSMVQENLGPEGDMDLAILPGKPLGSFKNIKRLTPPNKNTTFLPDG